MALNEGQVSHGRNTSAYNHDVSIAAARPAHRASFREERKAFLMSLPASMKVVEISAPGAPEVLKPAERPVPQPKDNEVLVKVAAAGVNGPDIMQRKGLYPAPAGASDLPGLEISGEIVAVGAAVKRWKGGERVCARTTAAA